MMNKNLFILIAAFIAGLLIGILLFSGEDKKENLDASEETRDEIVILLENIKEEIEIDFSEIEDLKFKWNVEKNQKIEEFAIQGKGFEAKGTPAENYEKIEAFFQDNDFEINLQNISAGTISEAAGYKKDKIVCLVIEGAAGYEEAEGQWIPPEPDKKDVKIKCGKGGDEIEPVISKDEAIKRLFADKYNKKVSAVTINITKETENHIRGTVKFEDEEWPENSGAFLAAMVYDNWELVFDGQGVIYCEEMEKYNFPENMIEDCAEINAK
jgi:hypothetical protein